MAMTRRLTLIECTGAEETMDLAVKVAFASTDRKHIDQHFGSALAFTVYEVSPDGNRFLEVIEFAPAAQDGNEDKLQAKIDALAGCAAVYVQAVGASAIGQLRAKGVQPLKVTPGTPIAAQLALLGRELADCPPVWAQRAFEAGKDPGRFDLMEAEGWDE